jgi:plasmid rolling circle replication initiator protein Rep
MSKIQNSHKITEPCTQTSSKSPGSWNSFTYTDILNTPETEFGAPFNKLEQLPTDERKKWLKKARKKYHTQSVTTELLKLKSPLYKQYLRALNCSNTLTFKNGKIKAELCRTRICVYCNNIRTANLINGYQEEIEKQIKGEKAFFVTLTRQNIESGFLRSTIKDMNSKFTNIIRVLNEKRNWSISGIRAVETTYNNKRNDYHPHIHAIVYGDNLPDDWQSIFLQEWKGRHKKGEVSLKGQKIQQATPGTMKELFKYFTKMANKGKNKNEIEFYPEALDIILRAYKGLRTIQNFGKLKKVNEEPPKHEVTETETPGNVYAAYWEKNDWRAYDHMGNNFLLTNYKPIATWKALKIEPPG